MPQTLWYGYKVYERQKSLKLRGTKGKEKLRSEESSGIPLRANAGLVHARRTPPQRCKTLQKGTV